MVLANSSVESAIWRRKDPGLPQIAGRYGVSWFWRNDPELFVTYSYIGTVEPPA